MFSWKSLKRSGQSSIDSRVQLFCEAKNDHKVSFDPSAQARETNNAAVRVMKRNEASCDFFHAT